MAGPESGTAGAGGDRRPGKGRAAFSGDVWILCPDCIYSQVPGSFLGCNLPEWMLVLGCLSGARHCGRVPNRLTPYCQQNPKRQVRKNNVVLIFLFDFISAQTPALLDLSSLSTNFAPCSIIFQKPVTISLSTWPLLPMLERFLSHR